MSRPHSASTASLEPPRKSTELHDPGAHDLQSSGGEEEYYSDASEGRRQISRPATPSSPIPKTRIEKVDASPRYGEMPGTAAYDKRTFDAVPDEVAIVSEGRLSKRNSQYLETPTTPGGTVIPRTVVEKVDPHSPSYGEDPAHPAFQKRQADAVPDLVLNAPEAMTRKREDGQGNRERAISNVPIPETIVTRVDSNEAYGEVKGTEAYEKRKLDASPDKVERENDVASPVITRSIDRAPSNDTIDDSDDDPNPGETGDDFDDFEEGAQAAADDDFGDFDDGFDEPELEAEPESPIAKTQSIIIPEPSFPLIDFESLDSYADILQATQSHLDAMFPLTAADKISSLPKPDPIPDISPIFPTDRSRSLWKQLVTPPPLQPPNWTQSRIRRLFLVSLGVPVDLDEILPPSKQKKLILPDINLDSSNAKTDAEKGIGSVARLKAQAANDSTASVDSTQSGTNAKQSRPRRPRGPTPPPELDLIAVKRLCATTDEKLEGFTDNELKEHVKELEMMTERTSELLEYWLKRRDGLRKEKEAFEGVIENLVAHVRRVRR